MPRERDEGRVAEATRLYVAGLTTRQIAARLGADATTVQRWLGGSVRRRGPRQNGVADQRILDYRDRAGLAFGRIAVLTGMSKTGVRMRYYQLTRGGRPDRA